jgi:hypothetical protein
MRRGGERKHKVDRRTLSRTLNGPGVVPWPDGGLFDVCETLIPGPRFIPSYQFLVDTLNGGGWVLSVLNFGLHSLFEGSRPHEMAGGRACDLPASHFHLVELSKPRRCITVLSLGEPARRLNHGQSRPLARNPSPISSEDEATDEQPRTPHAASSKAELDLGFPTSRSLVALPRQDSGNSVCNPPGPGLSASYWRE